ncbi:MAG: NAD-dependent epimerase/dehydratase family protein [Thermoanaerobaculia bacterium]|jgi:nucleoside-diphosphate-sugar epimerase|nr:NAD-dependent epimerase/dehydratase family protein [Thermoanaerobaculia bacterium]
MRLFLTGATGYIGTALCLRLRAEGHEVRALVRATSARKTLELLNEIGVATFAGDLRDRYSMREGMSGADWVIHAAAELDLQASDEGMAAANVEGSENVASLASKLGVPRFLSISSMAAWGGSPADGTPANEASPPQLPLPTRYCATKAAGEARVQQWARQGLKVNTVFPSLVYGPPGKKQGANTLLRALLLGRFPALIAPEKKTSWVFLDDLVDGIVRVMDQAPPGRGYLMAGEAWTVRELAHRVAAFAGTNPPKRELSVRTARLLFRLAGPFLKLAGRPLPIPLEQLASLDRHWNFDDTRARTELGWHPRGLEEGLAITLDYLRKQEAAMRPQ